VTAPNPTGRRRRTDHSDDLSFALEVANRAGQLLMDRYERVERIDYKSARDVVTEVDHLSESLILDAIRATFPHDGILAEESGEHASVKPADGARRVWVVDPLDGTINYANGIPFFCVSIGLVVDGRPSVGVVHDPARRETFSAAMGLGARLDGRPIEPSDKERLSDFVISLALSGRAVARRAQAVRKAIRVPRSMGSAALALAYVANGRFDAFVQQGGLSAWDVAAGGLIAECAGATVTDMQGGRWFDAGRGERSIGMIAAPAAHHGALLDLVRG
jgi:fructose-1,6-bisphosphatase/inositol monophosphatase family enzyme